MCVHPARHLLTPLFAERDYIATRKVRYVVRDFAVVNLHKQALKASEAAACASGPGQAHAFFREAIEALLSSQK